MVFELIRKLVKLTRALAKLVKALPVRQPKKLDPLPKAPPKKPGKVPTGSPPGPAHEGPSRFETAPRLYPEFTGPTPHPEIGIAPPGKRFTRNETERFSILEGAPFPPEGEELDPLPDPYSTQEEKEHEGPITRPEAQEVSRKATRLRPIKRRKTRTRIKKARLGKA